MKKLFIFLFSIITIISCSKDPTKPEPQPPSDEIVLQDNVTEFKDSELTEITNITPTSIEFSDSTYTEDLEIGSIIVGGISEKTPYGFLRKVVSISSNKTTLTTEYAALSDLIKSGKIEIKSALFPKILQKKSLNQGFNLKPSTNGGFNFTYPFSNFVVYDLDNNYSTTNDQLRINGNLDFNAALDLELTFLPVKVDLTSEVMTELTLRAEAELTGTIDKEKKVGELYFTPLTIGVVVVTPVIESFVGIRGDLSASATAGIRDELTIQAGIHYSGGWTTSDSIKNKFTFDSIEVSLDGTLRGYAKAKLSFIFYELVGPSVYASPYLEGQIHINQTPWWILYAGSEGGLGIKMGRLIPFINDYELPLVDYPILLAQASSSANKIPNAYFTVSPNSGTTTTTFNFDASGCSDIEDPVSVLQVRWDWENDGTWDTGYLTSKTATHQYATTGTKTINLEVKDSGGLTDFTTKQVTVSSGNTAPTSSFIVNPTLGTTSTVFNFDASGCTDNEDPTSALQVRWDWENDGTWDTGYSTTKTATHQYSTIGIKIIKLEVKDTGGFTDSTTSQISITEGIGTVTDIDGNLYKTVKIGDQWWMAENLKVTHYRNGEAIPNVTANTEWTGLGSGAWCSYNNDNGNIETYGLLYNWYAVEDSRNIAPAGWHVPTDEEWKELEMHFGMSQSDADNTGWRGTDEGSKLKAKNGWYSDGNGTNESGFTALPGGYRISYGNYHYIGGSAYFWSSTENLSSTAWYRHLGYDNLGVYRYDIGYKRSGFSVRLVRG